MKQVTNILISFLLVFSIYSCKEDTKIIVPAVEIAGADAGPTTLSFYIAHAGATSGAYLCLPEDQTLPSTAAEVLENGKYLEMDKQEIVVSGLETNKSYNIVVAVENEHRNAISNTINMKTSILVPSIVSVREGDVSFTSLTFSVEYKYATSGSYMCIPKGGSIPTEASDVINNGTPFAINDKSTTITVNDLESGMEYTILVAVANEYAARMYTPFTMVLPTADDPIITINEGETTNHSFTFSTSVSHAQEAAWMVLPASEKKPSTTTVLENGEKLNTDGEITEISLDNLEQGKEYIVYVAAKNYNKLVCKTLNFTIIKGDFMIGFDIATYKTYSNSNRELILYSGTKERPDYKLTLDLHFNSDTLIPAGEYEVKNGMMYGSINTKYSKFEIKEEGKTLNLSSGTTNITVSKKGVYTIDIDIILSDGRNLATSFTGTLSED